MHPSLVRAQFKASLGRDPDDVYRTFDPVPFAAASLGQVHRAVTNDGETVAVKIQYPGIRDAIENDFAWFRAVSKPAQLSKYLPESALDELQEQIVAECDYVTKDGETVAVKIQYPGIRDAIENDFAWFRAVSKPGEIVLDGVADSRIL